MNKLAVNLLQLALITFVVAIILRFCGYNNAHGLVLGGLVNGITPSAFQRVANTILFFSIAVSLANISQNLCKDKTTTTEENQASPSEAE